MNDVLKKILVVKRREIRDSRKLISLKELQRAAEGENPVAGFREKLLSGFRVIAEVKKASPSKGVLRPDFDPEAIAKSYIGAGADALSVLTDREFFQGSPDYLRAIARFAKIPLLRKDFILDEYQIHEAREMGACMILLIAACLRPGKLKRFLRLCRSLGLEALTEVHDAREVRTALSCGADMIGVNNRDLRSFRTDLGVSLSLIRSLPRDVPCVSESGIKTREDILRLRDAGFAGVLVGEAFISAPDPGAALRAVLP